MTEQPMESKDNVLAQTESHQVVDRAAAATGCCGPTEQAVCCEPSAKAACCGAPKGQECGCL